MLVFALHSTPACVGSGQGVPLPVADSGAVPKTFEEILTMLLEPACVQQCHRGGNAPKGLSLEAHRVISDLVGVPSVEVPSLLRVAPGDPSGSYLITKLVQSDPRRVGSRMPRNGPPFLSNQQILALKQWISAGATDDWSADDSIDLLPPSDATAAADGGPDSAGPDDVGPTDAQPVELGPLDAETHPDVEVTP